MRHTAGSDLEAARWQDELFNSVKRAGVRQILYVPDAGHSRIIQLVQEDPQFKPIVLTTEEEGVAAACGAWLGGERSVLLMQSSGVGNCVNMLSLVTNCRFPFATIVAMRGEWGEFNPWQVRMGRATETILELMGVSTFRCDTAESVGPTVEAALETAFSADQTIAILLSQKMIGRKAWK